MASGIKIIYDITQQTWNFSETELSAIDSTTLEFSFISKDTMTYFTDLKFGIALYQGNEIELA